MNLKATYYLNAIKRIKRGTHDGRFVNAKPLYLYAVIRGIEEGLLLGNILRYESLLSELYDMVCENLEPSCATTPFYKPYYHSVSEEYYHIKWKKNAAKFTKAHTPSAKFLRENVEYAYLDDQFWDLLQDKETREEYKKAIVDLLQDKETREE